MLAKIDLEKPQKDEEADPAVETGGVADEEDEDEDEGDTQIK